MKGFGETSFKEIKEHSVFHHGIDRFVDRITSSIAFFQFRCSNPLTIWITNDIPNDPRERSLGLTAAQIEELEVWLTDNRSRLPKNLEVRVLRIEDSPEHGMLWQLKDFTRLMTKIQF